MPKGEYTYERVYFTFEGRKYEASGKTKEEAIAKAALKKQALERGDTGVSKNMTVSRWATEWLETYKEPKVGKGQLDNYKNHINNVIIPMIGSKKLKDVKDIDLQKVLNSREGKSKSDIMKLTRTIKAMFRQARISRLLIYDPAEAIEPPAAKDGTHRSITKVERKFILTLAETHYSGLWIKTLLYTGLRPGESRALDWKDIDLENGFLHVRRAMKASSKEIGTPKSAAGVRSIPIPEILLKDLRDAQKAPNEPVFIQPTTSKRHTKVSMQCLWNNFKRELDISMGAELYRNQIVESKLATDLVPYCLRHTYGTDLQDAGVPINIAKYLMGHSTVAMTANIYTHTSEDAISDALVKMQASFVQKAQDCMKDDTKQEEKDEARAG